MPANWNGAVRQPFKHDAGVDDHTVVRCHCVDPVFVDLDLQSRGRGARQRGDQIDVAVLSRPHVGGPFAVLPGIREFSH